MDKEVAKRIRTLRIGPTIHSLRRIAEMIVDEHPNTIIDMGWDDPSTVRGNQLLGQELCAVAAKVLHTDWRDWEDEVDFRYASKRSQN